MNLKELEGKNVKVIRKKPSGWVDELHGVLRWAGRSKLILDLHDGRELDLKRKFCDVTEE